MSAPNWGSTRARSARCARWTEVCAPSCSVRRGHSRIPCMRLCAATSLSVRYSLSTGPGKHADPRFVAARRGATSPPNSADGPVGLNLVVAAIVLWNTVYVERAVETLRASGTVVPDELLQHLSPLA